MTLSNTATPIYYGKFRKQVMKGKIPVCKEITMEMNRIDALIADPDIYYDDEAIDGFIAFCENELTLTDGSAVKMLESFKLWAEQIFGWWFFEEVPVLETGPLGDVREVMKVVKKRLTVKQYLIVARGSAKSMYASFLQSYFLNIDIETTHQITTAPTMKQAEEVMSPIRTAIIRTPGPLFKFFTLGSLQNTTGSRFNRQKLVATKKGIENFLTGSLLEIRPMTVNKLQGLRTKMNTIDEWLSGDLREDVVGAIEQGASKVPGYLIVAISSEGVVRNGPGDSMKMELHNILRAASEGDHYAQHISIWHYKLDDIKEVNEPRMWIKANPNIGITVEWSVYQLDVERAEKVPQARNDILAKRFGIPMAGTSYFFAYHDTLPHDHVPNFWQMPCAVGADLSRGDDFCAFTLLFPLGGSAYGILTRSYVTDLTMRKLHPAVRMKYDEFRNEDSLHVLEGTTLDMMEVYDDLVAWMEHDDNQFDYRALGYDPYNAKEFVERWILENGDFAVEKVIQGARTESVPLGELRTLAEERKLIFNQGLMTYTMGNAVTEEDSNGNRKLLKLRHEEKIDNVAALMDAYVAYKAHKEAFE